MTKLQILTFILILGLFSYNGKTENFISIDENVLSEVQESVSISDTIKKFVVDDYPVTNEMFGNGADKNSRYEKQSSQLLSYDKVWFGNDTLKQTLVFELYADYHRLVTYHFLDNDIPTDLINRMELHISGGELASEEEKLKNFDGFLKHTEKINSLYFVTNKGFRLGSIKHKAIEVYGNPDKQTNTVGLERLEWNFIGDEFYDDKIDLKGKPLAENSFGHQIIMYFKNGKLVGQILVNEIP